MQTFLPYPSFLESAKVLDNKRLGKQRVEAYQILRVLTGQSKGWRNHPAVQMWKGHEFSLRCYGRAICYEWIKRGFKDRLFIEFDMILGKNRDQHQPPPKWLGNERFHASHRSNLLRKDPKHYGQFGWKEKPDQAYFWPTKNGY
jgi:hypothetical protein